jgi:hypothetical protein
MDRICSGPSSTKEQWPKQARSAEDTDPNRDLGRIVPDPQIDCDWARRDTPVTCPDDTFSTDDHHAQYL